MSWFSNTRSKAFRTTYFSWVFYVYASAMVTQTSLHTILLQMFMCNTWQCQSHILVLHFQECRRLWDFGQWLVFKHSVGLGPSPTGINHLFRCIHLHSPAIFSLLSWIFPRCVKFILIISSFQLLRKLCKSWFQNLFFTCSLFMHSLAVKCCKTFLTMTLKNLLLCELIFVY